MCIGEEVKSINAKNAKRKNFLQRRGGRVERTQKGAWRVRRHGKKRKARVGKTQNLLLTNFGFWVFVASL